MTRIDIAEVLDRSPVTRFHWRVVVLGILIMTLDGYDIGVIGFIVPAIAADWGQSPAVFGPALASSLLGVAFGSVLAGLLGDRIGRRLTLVGVFAFGGACTLATALADGQVELMFWRFLTGIGMGGAIPNVIALTSELMPAARRTFLVVLVYSGAPLGATLSSLLAAHMIPAFGWESVFIVGGSLPFAIGALALFLLPESPRFLVARGRAPEKVRTLVRSIDPSVPVAADDSFFVREEVVRRARMAELFRHGRAAPTLLLWILFMGTQASVFFIGGWLASLLTQAGFTLPEALYSVSLFNFGALAGGLLGAWLSDQYAPERILAVAYVLAAASFAALGLTAGSAFATPALSFAVGASVVGASLCLGAMAAGYYPTDIRSTGLGWGLSIGRVGSIVSPLLGGAALGAGLSVAAILSAAAVPSLACFVSVLVLHRVKHSRAPVISQQPDTA